MTENKERTNIFFHLGACLAFTLSCAGENVIGGGDGQTRVDAGADARPVVEAGAESGADSNRSAGEASQNRDFDATPSEDVCANVSATARPQPVYMAFAFDVSGSMGKGDRPWHDKSLKWDPIVQASRAFFEDSASDGLTASLTFFPGEGGEDERCLVETYSTPDVPMTALPSTAFGEAIAEIEPQSEDDWRGGTPTLWVVRGTIQFLREFSSDHPGNYALVLVTDGYPQDCDDDSDSIEAVVSEVQAAADDEISTFVIGVANPPVDDAPDTVSDLQDIAEAGGTSRAHIIDTGNPEATAQSFQQAVDEIRIQSISCALDIPPPPDGRTFERDKVIVTFISRNSGAQILEYDDSCGAPGAWHYDDASDPTQIVLCDNTCDLIRAADTPELSVEFTCASVIIM